MCELYVCVAYYFGVVHVVSVCFFLNLVMCIFVSGIFFQFLLQFFVYGLFDVIPG
jgi:hypothetical protein